MGIYSGIYCDYPVEFQIIDRQLSSLFVKLLAKILEIKEYFLKFIFAEIRLNKYHFWRDFFKVIFVKFA